MKVGVVLIGRNEGERLRRCLAAVVGQAEAVVYVDSGSTDGSVALAAGMGVLPIGLDMSHPFSAARARNAGFNALVGKWPTVSFIQFVDGDCELAPGWLALARDALERRNELAAVAGHLRERSPGVSIYNRLGELEWNFLGSGDVGSVGGIFMVRRAAFERAGGFDPSVPAGEEPELCKRLTEAGWIISRLDAEMASHDLAMTRFSQWWRRQVRGGYGALDVTRRFGLSRFRKQTLRARFWSAWPALVVLAGFAIGWEAAALTFSLWPVQMVRIAFRTWRQGQSAQVALAYAFYTMLSYWPQMQGQLQYMLDRMRNRASQLIEYKQLENPSCGSVIQESSLHDNP
jgi:glycosyltransferase involved in cell wall biosynthesis